MIDNLQELENKIHINKSVMDKIREKHKKQGVEEENYLTELQKAAFSEPDFWDASKHIIVQGRTSSGKTLVAQIAAAYYGMQESTEDTGGRMGIVYLVPLRAMVSEKRTEFISLFEETLGWKVYASSSDYQDHDEDILSAEFDIAVIVYEKFFALLAQDNDTSFIKHCGLVIVDELQMMNDEDRGPKLEISLTKILKSECNCKIIGLTTTQCDIVEISKWLKAKAIVNFHRPKALEEYVIWPGEAGDSFRYYMLEEPEDGIIDLEKHRKHSDKGEKINLENQHLNIYENDVHVEQKMIPALISHILQEGKEERNQIDRTEKILIFINNRRDTKRIAEDICVLLKEMTQIHTDLTNDKEMNFLLTSEDEDANDMIIHTLPYGVAYHHGGLSRGLRDYVESEFRNKEGKIRIVVATETLAIGVDMPADIVILAGVARPNGKSVKNQMRSYEYKNYVGRAGRLGKGSTSKGKSFLLATAQIKANDYWERYINAKQIPILSALGRLKEKEQVPFFFNLYDISQMTVDDFNTSILYTFAFYNSKDTKGTVLPGGNFLNYLMQYGLVEDGGKYSRSRVGEKLVSYALELDTVSTIDFIWQQIKKFFDEKQIDSEKIIIFFKEHYLDLLYCLSEASELRNVFVQNRDELVYTKRAFNYVRHMQNNLIEGMPLRDIIDGVFNQGKPLPNISRSFALKRAISMLGWIKGKTIKQIKDETGLDYIAFGDLDRLGDVFAYLWEAMLVFVQVKLTNSAITESEIEKISGPLTHFSGCFKYGIPEDLVILASRHVQYVTREQLMLLRDEAKEKQQSAVQYIRNPFLSEPPKAFGIVQYRQMVEELNKYYYASSKIGNITSSIKRMKRRGLLDRKTGKIIWEICRWEDDDIITKLGCLLNENVIKKPCVVFENHIELRHEKKRLLIYCLKGNEVITAKEFLNAEQELNLQEQNLLDNDVCIYISKKGFVKNTDKKIVMQDVYLSVTAFIKLYLLSLKKTSALTLFCMSLCSGYNFIPDDDQALYDYIMNYMPQGPVLAAERETTEKKRKKQVKLYVIHDKVGSAKIYDDFLGILTEELANEQLELVTRIMNWGDRLNNFADELIKSDDYVLTFIDDNYQNQRGLPILMEHLKGNVQEKRFCVVYYNEAVKQSYLEKYQIFQKCKQIQLEQSVCRDKAKEVSTILKNKKEKEDMFDVFISYVHGQDIASMMKNALEKKGCNVFIDKYIHIGDSLVKSINNALAKSKSYLLVIDKEYTDSAWTKQELDAAFSMALKDRRLLPLFIDDDAKRFWIDDNPLFSVINGRCWSETNAEDLSNEIIELLKKDDKKP